MRRFANYAWNVIAPLPSAIQQHSDLWRGPTTPSKESRGLRVYLDQAKAMFARFYRFASDVYRRFDEEHIAYPDGQKHIPVVRGCTEAEVVDLEQRIGSPLPTAYREFLLWIGQSAGYLLRGSDVFYQDLKPLRAYAEELLEENQVTIRLPDDAFVFYMHQGYQFSFFRLSDGDNPPVYFFGEGEGLDTFRLSYPLYNAYLEAEIRGYIEIAINIDEHHQHRLPDRPSWDDERI